MSRQGHHTRLLRLDVPRDHYAQSQVYTIVIISLSMILIRSYQSPIRRQLSMPLLLIPCIDTKTVPVVNTYDNNGMGQKQ